MSTRAQFQESIEMLRVDVDALGLMAQQAVEGALAALVGGDRSVAERVLAGDDRIDALFVALEERAYALIAQQAPVAADLRFLMSSLRVMADFEKTGDRAVALAKSALADWDRERPPSRCSPAWGTCLSHCSSLLARRGSTRMLRPLQI